jgi:hypothetical protein
MLFVKYSTTCQRITQPSSSGSRTPKRVINYATLYNACKCLPDTYQKTEIFSIMAAGTPDITTPVLPTKLNGFSFQIVVLWT